METILVQTERKENGERKLKTSLKEARIQIETSTFWKSQIFPPLIIALVSYYLTN
jgi:hypothetical protein